MRGAADLRVPLEVNLSCGATWADAKGLGDGHDHWFEPIADHLGSAYLRYSFTKGTAQEVAFLVDDLALGPGTRVLDVGCGPGRHALGAGRAGHRGRRASTSAQRFVDLARERRPGLPATFVRRRRPDAAPSTASSTPPSRCAREPSASVAGRRTATVLAAHRPGPCGPAGGWR